MWDWFTGVLGYLGKYQLMFTVNGGICNLVNGSA